MKYRILHILILLLVLNSSLFAQSISVTYTGGDIPTSYPEHEPACNGASNQIVITLDAPGSFTITGIDASWNFEAIEPGWISHQASILHFVNENISSDIYTADIEAPGINTYTLSNDPFMNGTFAGPVDLVFELWAWRTFDDDAGECNTSLNLVNNYSWTLTVYYTYTQDILADIYKGGIGDGYSFDFKTDLNTFMPSSLAAIYKGGIGDGYDYDFKIGLNSFTPSTLANIYRGGIGDGYDHDLLTGLNIYMLPTLADIYHGGIGDGYDHDLLAGLITFMPSSLADIYKGGIGDGYDHDLLTGLNIYIPPTLADIYHGGIGDGYDHDLLLGLNIYVPPTLAAIYRGGVGDGYDSHYLRFLNPNCQNDIFLWTGAFDTNWFNLANWNCNQLPSATSHVIISRDVPNYPYVTGDHVIASLKLQNNTTIKFSNNILFRVGPNQ